MKVVFALNSFLGLQIAQQTIEANKYCSIEANRKEMSSEVIDVTHAMGSLGSFPLSNDQAVGAARQTALEAKKINPGAEIYVAFADGQIDTEQQCRDRSVAVSITKEGQELISYGNATGAGLDPHLGSWGDNKYPDQLKTAIFAVIHGWGDTLEQGLNLLSRALPSLSNLEKLTGNTRNWIQQNALGTQEITQIKNGLSDFETQLEAIKQEASKLLAVHRATSSQRIPGISRNIDGPIGEELLPRLENALKDIKSTKTEIDAYLEKMVNIADKPAQELIARNMQRLWNDTRTTKTLRIRM